MPASRFSRRYFLAGSAAAGAGLMLSSTRLRAQGANDDIRVAVIGFNGRGSSLIGELLKVKGARLVALCDADQAVLDKKVAQLSKGDKPVKLDQTTQDLRRVLENKDIDAIVTATPNHWHSLITVWACQAGKDIYTEKPVSHNIWEGRKATEAVEKYKRIAYAGTQRRSDVNFKKAVEWLHAGNLGKILYARAFCYKPRGEVPFAEPGKNPIPSTVDYDLWAGPTPKVPIKRKSLHYDWHWVWETGNGDIGNQGIHEMDQGRWALQQPALAPRVFSFGGRFVYDNDAATTPNTLISVFDYQPAPLIFEVRGLPVNQAEQSKRDPRMDAYKPGDVRIGVVVKCEGGYFASGNGGGWTYDNSGKKIEQFVAQGNGDHMANFIKAVRSRRQSDITAPMLEGHVSSALCHMGNVSYRLGAQKSTEEIAETVKSDKNAMDSLERLKTHLAANGLDLTSQKVVLGPSLEFDPKAERFTGTMGDAANKYVKDEYRAPFVIPDNV
jgi:hypothetical protein